MYKIIHKGYILEPQNTTKKYFGWLDSIRETLINCGLSGIWQTHTFLNKKWIKASVNQKLKDLFINDWHTTLNTSSSCYTYRIVKDKFGFEEYLTNTPLNLMKYVIKFRTRNHSFPIETGRYNNIDRNDRLCRYCNTDIGDQFHYLFVCKHFSHLRKKYIKPAYYARPNILKFKSALNCDLGEICLYCL